MMYPAKYIALIMLAIIGLIAVIITIAWYGGADPLAPGNWSARANDAIGPWRTVLMLLRWSLWGLLWWRWVQLGQRLFRGDTEGAIARRQHWAGMRKRMLGGIAIVEFLMLCTNITGESGWV